MRFQQLNPHSCKTYLIGQDDVKDVFLVDPVLDHFNDYLKYLQNNDLKLKLVIDSHTHADHISGCAALKDITSCDYMMHELAPAKCANERVVDGQKLIIGNILLTVLHTPGHTRDSMSLILPHGILTGDALFLDDGGAGRDDLPGGNPGQHWETLKKFRSLSEELVVYPAHDYRNRSPSSLGKQKVTNPHLKDRTKDEFIHFIEDLRLGPADWMKDVLKANYTCARDVKAAWIPADHPACEIKGTLEHGVNDIVVEDISPLNLKDLLKMRKDIMLLDVRQKKELKGELGHLEGITHIPISELSKKLSDLDGFKDKTIITICRSGSRAHTAAQILKQAGFKDVKVLAGGMIAWRNSYKENNS